MRQVNEVLVHIDTYPRKNWKKGGRKAAIDLPTHTEIEEEVRRVLQERVPEIVGVTRVMSHYEEGASLLSFPVSCPSCTVSDCRSSSCLPFTPDCTSVFIPHVGCTSSTL